MCFLQITIEIFCIAYKQQIEQTNKITWMKIVFDYILIKGNV